MPKFSLSYKLTVVNPDTSQQEETKVTFELSKVAEWWCRRMSIPIEVIKGNSTNNKKISGKTGIATRVAELDSAGKVIGYKFESKNRRGYSRKQISLPQYNRGKTLQLRTGLYGIKGVAGAEWLARTFTLRCPAWLNNTFVVDAVRGFFKNKFEFDNTPAADVGVLFPVVFINKIPYSIPKTDIITIGAGMTPTEAANFDSAQQAANAQTSEANTPQVSGNG